MNQQKVMIVGGGSGQIPIINCCKKHGLFTIVVSPYGAYPGIQIADKHINEDIYNIESLVNIGREEKIDYVISDQSDFAVPIVAYVANKLNLPGNDIEVATTYTYKSKFREFCEKNHIPAPKSFVIEDESDYIPELCPPLVVKPADSQGSRGISLVQCFSDLENAIVNAKKFSKHGKVVVEEFFKGKEVVCEGFVIDGKYHNVAFGDRTYFKLEKLFIPSKTIFPSSIEDEIKKKIVINEQKIASKLNPSFGIVHSEYLVNDEGEFVVIESALRGGGVYIASHLIPLSTGVDLTEALFEAMMGNKQKCLDILSPDRSKAAEYLCFYLKRGIVTSMPDMQEYNKMRNVCLAELGNLNLGDTIGCFEHKGMRKGPFIISASSLSEISRIEQEIKRKLVVGINNTNGIIWD